MATNNRSDIAIEMADRIAVLLIADDGDKHHARALQVINTFKAALELTAPPKNGPAAQAEGGSVMAETKSFDIRALGSITSGVLLLQDFGQVHEALEWLAGFPVWTHEIPDVCRGLAPKLVEQFPSLPARGEVGNWEECAARLLGEYPEKIALPKGSGERSRDPVTTLTAMLHGADGAP